MPSITLSRYLSSALRVAGLALTALALFALTALLCALLLTYLLGVGGAIPLAVLCGLVIWLFVAVFHVGRKQAVFPCADRESFVRQLSAELAELGYEPGVGVPDTLTFRPGFTSLLFGGAVEVRVTDKAATLNGPRLCLERVRRRLRLHEHLENAQHAVADARVPQSKHLLGRVRLVLRMPARHWSTISRDVIQVLLDEGAEVYCDVTLVAQSAGGVLDTTVEGVIRERLRQMDVQVNIHKEPLRPPAPPKTPASPS